MNEVYVRPPSIAVVETEDAVYLGELPRGPVHVLSGTAALIWENALGQTRAQVVHAVADAAHADEADVRGDVLAFLDDLTDRRLISFALRAG